MTTTRTLDAVTAEIAATTELRPLGLQLLQLAGETEAEVS